MRRTAQLLALLAAACCGAWADPPGPPAHLKVNKSHVENFTQGATGSWNIDVTNTGPGDISGPLTVTDALPGGLTLASFSGTNWDCTSSIGMSSVTCTDSTDTGGGDGTFPTLTLTVSVPATAPNHVNNTATATDAASNSAMSNMDMVMVTQAPANIVATSGSGQSAPAGSMFTDPLKATVTDAGGMPIAGVGVTFAPPATGPSAVFNGNTTVMTGPDGVAMSPKFSANAMVGSYMVTASAG